MLLSELENIIKKGESETVEFKSSFNKEVIETLTAFANTKGGYVFIGVTDAHEITGKTTQRNEIPEYPLGAIRELLLNSVIHRDYQSPVDIQIKIFDQSITFFNPGNLYGGITINDLKTDKYQSRARNKLIAEAFYLTGDIEKYGSGFERIRDEIKAYPTMKFEFQEIGNGFLTSLKYDLQKTSTKDVTKDDRKIHIIELIKDNPKITTEEIALMMNMGKRTILRDMEELKNENRIVRAGGRKIGYWEIIKKN